MALTTDDATIALMLLLFCAYEEMWVLVLILFVIILWG